MGFRFFPFDRLAIVGLMSTLVRTWSLIQLSSSVSAPAFRLFPFSRLAHVRNEGRVLAELDALTHKLLNFFP